MGRPQFWSDDDPVLRPYPLQPLLDMLGETQHDLQRLWKVNGSRVSMLCRRGWLTGDEADRLAVRSGFHPAEVWGSTWAADDVTALFERLREAS